MIVKATQSEESAVRFGHRIAGLLERCQEFDASFLPDYALRRTVLQEDVLLLRAASGMSKLSDDDREHFFRHEPLYVVAKHQGDLKYFPLRMKNRGTCCAVLVENWPDKYWIQFARDVRRYLQFPPDTRRDSIKEYIAGAPANGVSDEARDYLSQLYYSS
ncbi:MAG: hypothetical protein NTY63_02985 [Candidatus Bipolaricaulota bacterium]|nr:hypothetical protein [Candidatus Bipolaricaulota bacterium]